MSKKGFTFEQIAVLILVIMGLTVAVVLAATQLSKSGSQLAQLGGSSRVGANDAANAAGKLGTQCIAAGGFCVDNGKCLASPGPKTATQPYFWVTGTTDELSRKDCPTTKTCCKN